ncbi:hypothetical protein D3C72_2448180 [compost metagenome]
MLRRAHLHLAHLGLVGTASPLAGPLLVGAARLAGFRGLRGRHHGAQRADR